MSVGTRPVFNIMAAGFIPVITHPERLVWIEHHYDTFVTLARRGVWLQITAGALLGKFGKPARRWSERLLDDGFVHLIASDAHTTNMRNPQMAEAVKRAAALVGQEEARRMVIDRPQAILDNLSPEQVAPVPGLAADSASRGGSPWFRRLLGQ